MGSFSYTCGVSRLGISAGTSVRFIFMTEGPYQDERSSSFNSLWFPRAFPIRAKYNDYGSITEAEEGLGRDLIHEAFKIDLVSCGVGDNSVHDVSTSKAMGWEDLLDALQEGRIRVRQNVGSEQSLSSRVKHVYGKTPKGVPTMQRVRMALLKAGHPISIGSGIPGFLVDKIRYGTIRVRCADYGVTDHTVPLAKVQKCLKAYATVIKAGAGAYAHAADLMVHVKPGTKNFHEGRQFKDRNLSVSALMVREDVWQALLAIPASVDYGRTTMPSDDFRKAAYEVYEKCLVHQAETDTLMEALSEEDRETHRHVLGSLRMMLGSDRKNPFAPWVEKDEIPFTVGLGTNWRLLMEKRLPLEQVKPVVDAVAEMVHVVKVLMPARWQWTASNSCGPQFPEWGAHAQVLQAFLGIAEAEKKQEAEEDPNDEQWDAEATVHAE